MTVETEVLSFPADQSFGRITAYPPGEHEHPQLFEAIGQIEIPKNARLFLDFSQELCDDLGGIRLVPARLLENGVSFIGKKLDKTDFRSLREIEPRSLLIRSCNQIRAPQVRQLGALKSLTHLNLTYTPIDTQDFSWIAQLESLRTLILSGIEIDDGCLTFARKLSHLEDLHVDHSKISNRGVLVVWGMPELRALNLGQCAIGDAAFVGIGHCLALRSLDISGTSVSDKGVEAIVAEALQSGLQVNSVVLRSCRVTDQAIVRLASLRSLTFIDIFDTEVTAEGVAFLKGSLPECRIFVERAKQMRPSDLL